RERLDTGLGRPVGREVWTLVHRRVGGDEDDITALAVVTQLADDAAGDQHRTEQVRLDDAAIILVAHLVDRAGERGARIVHQYLYRARVRADVDAKGLDRRRVGDVEGVYQCRASGVGHDLRGLVEELDAPRAEADRPAEAAQG